MARLSNLKPRLGSLPTRLGYAPGDERARDRQRNASQVWRSWYRSARWRRLRERILTRDLFTCRMCGLLHAGKGTAVVDHVKPHRGDEVLFWQESNLQVLCKSPCHDKHKQAQERSGRDFTCTGPDGWPIA